MVLIYNIPSYDFDNRYTLKSPVKTNFASRHVWNIIPCEVIIKITLNKKLIMDYL